VISLILVICLKGLTPDVPFSFTLAKLMHSAGNANQNGTFDGQGQVPKRPGTDSADDDSITSSSPIDLLEQIFEKPQKYIEKLSQVRDALGNELTRESYGAKPHESKGCC
jgi:hypothetical protein